MACTQWNGDYGAALADGAFLDAILCPFQMQLGGVTFGLFVYGVVMVALYIRTESPTIPVVATIVASVLLLPQLPGGAVQTIVAVAMLALAVGGYLIATRLQNAT